MVLRLEGVVQSNNERVVAGSKNLLLCQRPLDLVPFDHLLLAQYYIPSALVLHSLSVAGSTFHGIESTGFLLPDQVYLPNVSLPNQLDFIEASRADLDILDLDRIGAVRPPESDRLSNLARGRYAIGVWHRQVVTFHRIHHAQSRVIRMLH